MVRAAKSIFVPQDKRKLDPPPPIPKIMTLKLSPPRCAISKENELINCDLENSFLLVYLSGPLIITHGHRGAPSHGWPPSQWACLWYLNGIHIAKFGLLIDRTSSIYLIMGLKALASVFVFMFYFTCSPEHKTFPSFIGLNYQHRNTFWIANLKPVDQHLTNKYKEIYWLSASQMSTNMF